MENKKLALPLILVAMGVVLSTAFSYSFATTPIGDTVKYEGLICACKNSGGICNANVPDSYCKHNTITNIGKNATRLYLSVDGTHSAFDVLALSNTSGVTADSYNFTTELTGGLARGAATVTNNPSTGNWSIVKTFTADATFMSVNTTGVFNDTAAGKGAMLAGGYFTAVNLNSGDTLTINYTLALA